MGGQATRASQREQGASKKGRSKGSFRAEKTVVCLGVPRDRASLVATGYIGCVLVSRMGRIAGPGPRLGPPF